MDKTLQFEKRTKYYLSFFNMGKKISILISSILLLVTNCYSQTNPSPQTLPYSQNFSSLLATSTSYPAGLQGWVISTSPSASFNANGPSLDQAMLASSTAATTNGSAHNYNGKIGFLNGGSLDLGICLAINTTNLSSIVFNYDIMTIRNPYDGSTNTRINEVTLQYRVGVTGAWTTLTGIEYQNNTTAQTTSVTTPQNSASKTITLPSNCNNQSVVQVRWISRQVSGGGSRPSFAIDNISVTGTTSCSTPTITLVSKTNPLCNGMTNGAIDLTVSAGTALWSDGNTNIDRTGLAAGTYTVTVTDGACSATASYTLTQPSLISVSASNAGVYCEGGVVDLLAVITGGTGVYPITNWSGPNGFTASTSSASIVPVIVASSGTYTLTVVDNNGCAANGTTSFTVNSYSPAGVTISPAVATCAGSFVNVIASPTNGGSSPTYAWYLNNTLQSGATSSSFTFTPSNGDQLYAKMTSNAACVFGNPATSSVSTYTVNPKPIATASITNVTCNGGSNGAIDINVSSGTSPITYFWTGGITTEDRVSLSAGTYTLTITDANSCSSSNTYVVTQPTAILAGSISTNSPQCLGTSINLVSTAFSGGTGSFTYSWTGPNSFTSSSTVTSVIPSNAGSSTYTITGTDANNCSATSSVSINVISGPVATASNNSPICAGSTLLLNGGTSGNTSYSWSGPSGYSASTITIPYTQNFDNLISSGTATWVDNSTIPNWYSQRTGTGTSYSVDAGTNTAGGLYSYGASGNSDRALGTLGSSNAAAGNFAHGVLLRNTSGATVTDIKVSYTLEQWRNSAAAAQSLNVYYKLSASPITDLTPNNTTGWTAVSGLTLSSPITGGTASSLNGNSAANKVSASNVSLGSISLPNNQYVMIKWEDPDQTGSDHGLSIDDVSVTMIANQQNPILSNVNASNSGTYTITVTGSNGCTSSSSTNVVINPLPTATVSGTNSICAGSSTNVVVDFTGTPPFLFDLTDGTTTSTLLESTNQYIESVSLSTSKNYSVVTVLDNNNCSNSGTGSAAITVNQATSNSTNITACNSYIWAYNNTTYTSSGTYTVTSTNAAGCIHSEILNLIINQSTSHSSSATACDSYNWAYNNATYTASGTYTVTSTNAANCVHSEILNLNINQSTSNTTTASSCNSYNWVYNNTTYTSSGSYTVTSINAAGCVHSEILNLTINQSTSHSASAISCDSYNWTYNNATYTTSGTYTVTSTNAAGCTHTEVLNLTINQSSSHSTSATSCDSYLWAYNNTTYTTSGTYTVTSTNAANCIHSEILNLTMNQSSSNITSTTSCDSYLWLFNNTTYSSSGTYTVTSTNAAGCSHADILHLLINHSTSNSTTTSSCNSYNWAYNNATYTASGTYTVTSTNAANCLHTEVLNLTINQSTSHSTSASSCDSYNWAYNNTTYTASGSYTVTSTNAAGCTHSEILNLTINQSTSHSSSATSCNSYLWTYNNATYTTSGTYTVTSTNAAGCTHLEILNLTINQSTSHSSSATSCNSYLWTYNNATYTTSGTYTVTSTNAAGCTHSEILNLTINQNTSHNTTATSCNSYLWTYNNATYTTSGTYTITSTNASGCTHSEILNVTINQSTSNSTTATACNSYLWTYNNATYTTSGTYTLTSTNAAGCTHSEILNVTINNSSSNGNATTTSCDSYTWNGSTYTTSGIYTFTSLNSFGCVNTATLNLTIHASTSNVSLASACDSYNWSVNNVTYSASGTYTSTSLNTAGCTHSEILQLAIIPNATVNTNVTNCGSYTWPVNGTTYTTSGTYSYTSSCTLQNLQLTILTTFTYNSTITNDGCYTWPLNGNTYSVSGTYTYTTTNLSTGCAELYNLNLTVNPGMKLNGKVLLQGPYDAALNLMTDSLRTLALIPLTEPYSSSPYNKVFTLNETSSEIIDPSILSITGPNAIVDWVFLELRNASNPSSLLYTKRALVQRDGDIVSHVDGVSPVFFNGVPAGSYYVSIKHRNHLGVMTGSAISFANCVASYVDFVNGTVAISSGISNTPRKLIGSKNVLWAGDCNANKNIKYNGLSNDKDAILNSVGVALPNNTINNVYRMEDANMDGKIRYNNVDNDRLYIINNLGVTTPNNIFFQHTPN